MANLLLIEGLPGTGKSSLAKSLAAEFSSRKLAHRLILESDEINPLRFQSGTSAETSIPEFLTTVRAQWADFIGATLGSHITIIQEGMTFQQQVNYLTWLNQSQEIRPIVEDLIRTIAPMPCRLIYLRNRNPRQAMNELMNIRGPSWITEKVRPVADSPYAKARGLTFPDALDSLVLDLQLATDNLFQAVPFAKSEIDVTNKNWDNIYKQALSFALSD